MSPPVVHFVLRVAALNFWAFLRSFARRRLKNWISVGDRITGLFQCMAPMFQISQLETFKLPEVLGIL